MHNLPRNPAHEGAGYENLPSLHHDDSQGLTYNDSGYIQMSGQIPPLLQPEQVDQRKSPISQGRNNRNSADSFGYEGADQRRVWLSDSATDGKSISAESSAPANTSAVIKGRIPAHGASYVNLNSKTQDSEAPTYDESGYLIPLQMSDEPPSSDLPPPPLAPSEN